MHSGHQAELIGCTVSPQRTGCKADQGQSITSPSIAVYLPLITAYDVVSAPIGFSGRVVWTLPALLPPDIVDLSIFYASIVHRIRRAKRGTSSV